MFYLGEKVSEVGPLVLPHLLNPILCLLIKSQGGILVARLVEHVEVHGESIVMPDITGPVILVNIM